MQPTPDRAPRVLVAGDWNRYGVRMFVASARYRLRVLSILPVARGI